MKAHIPPSDATVILTSFYKFDFVLLKSQRFLTSSAETLWPQRIQKCSPESQKALENPPSNLKFCQLFQTVIKLGVAEQQWKRRYREQIDGQGQGKGGRGETNGEIAVSMYTNVYKQTASGHLLYDSGNSKWGSVIT